MSKKKVLKFVPDERAINVFTDGSAHQSPRQKKGPRRGGIGIVIVTINPNTFEDEVEQYPKGGYPDATNNMMELKAAIEGLKIAMQHPRLNQVDKILMVTDSEYVETNHDVARFQWAQNKWRNRNDKPVDNAELWKELVSLLKKSKKRVVFQWVKAHANSSPYNAMADRLAKQSANEITNKPLSVAGVRRKKTDQHTRPGSVSMEGQTLDIHVVETRWKRLAKVHRYRYEVLSPTSPDYGCMDFAHSEREVNLTEGHHYRVTFNTDQKNPQIIELIEELER